MCAMSIIKSAPFSSAICRNLSYSNSRGYADAPITIIAGLKILAEALSASISIKPFSLDTEYGKDSKKMDVALIFFLCIVFLFKV